MKPLTRRSVMSGSAAVIASSAAAAVPVAMASVALDPNKRVLDLQAALKDALDHVTPITPAEYLTEMETNGWRPLVSILNGKPLRGVSEWTVRDWPTREDVDFLYYVNCRVRKSGADFYDRAGEYLVQQGRVAALGAEKQIARGLRPA